MPPLCTSALLAVALALAGCANPVPVKSMAKDPGAYSAGNFSRANIPFQAGPALPGVGTVAMGFRQLTLKGGAEPAKPTPGHELSLELQLFNDDDSGMLRSVKRIDSNGIPISYLFEYTYHGLVPLAYQDAGLSGAHAPATRYASDITRWDSLLPLKRNATYGYTYKLGYRSPLASSNQIAIECRSGLAAPASAAVRRDDRADLPQPQQRRRCTPRSRGGRAAGLWRGRDPAQQDRRAAGPLPLHVDEPALMPRA